MKKFIIVIITILMSVVSYAQNNFFIELIKPCEQAASIGISHSLVHKASSEGYSFNHITEYYLSLLCIEMSFYNDTHNYSEDSSQFTKYINDKSHIDTRYHSTQFGFGGMKFGYKAKYISLGIAFSFGADKVQSKVEDTHLCYINQHYQTWDVYSVASKYNKYSCGIYFNAHYPIYYKICGIEPFISFQLVPNGDNYISLGISLVVRLLDN